MSTIYKIILFSSTIVLVNSHWLSPCGFVYNKEEYLASRIFPKNSMHDLRHLINKVSHLLQTPELNIFNDIQYEENWIPDTKILQRYEGFTSPSKILKHILPEAFRSLQIFAFALQVNIESMRDSRDDKEPDVTDILHEILKKNAQMICETDLIMRKYRVHFESISNESEQYTIPADWIQDARSSHKTHRKLKQNEVLFKYQQFLIVLLKILS